MNEGTLQQMGTPNDIYDRPANRFVAEFVGSPPINILTFGKPGVSDIADKAEAYFSARYPGLQGIGSIGVRPEAMGYVGRIEDVPQGEFSAEMTVTGVLPTGGSWILELKSANHTLFLTTHALPCLEGGERVFFHAPPEALHVFDVILPRLAGIPVVEAGRHGIRQQLIQNVANSRGLVCRQFDILVVGAVGALGDKADAWVEPAKPRLQIFAKTEFHALVGVVAKLGRTDQSHEGL